MNPLIHQWRHQDQRAIMAAKINKYAREELGKANKTKCPVTRSNAMAALSLSRTEFLDAAIAEAVLHSTIRESRQC